MSYRHNLGFRSFTKARKFAHNLKLKAREDWHKYCRSGKKPIDIPATPDLIYKKQWKGWGDWLGTGTVASQDKVYMKFEQGRDYTHKLKLRNREQWNEFVKSGKKPASIPSRPDHVYRKYWKSWGDWLGTGTVAVFNRDFLPFEEARKYARALNLGSLTDWVSFCTSGKKLETVPSNPNQTYKKFWKSWGDWLGTGTIAGKYKKYRPFYEARTLVHKLKFSGQAEWNKYSSSGKKPYDIPSHPSRYKEWKGWGDWLGTGTVANIDKTFRSYPKAAEYVHNLHLKNRKEWYKYAASGSKPEDIPTSPNDVYKDQWKGWGDWLGTGAIAAVDREFRSFEEARAFARKLNLERKEDWIEYCKNGNIPDDIPFNPPTAYKDKWTWWSDWLGYEEEGWSIRNVKELLGDLINSKVLYNWDEAVLYSFLLRKGVLNLHNNRHAIFFRQLIDASSTPDGKKAIEEYAKSDSENPPDLSKMTRPLQMSNPDNEIQKLSSNELMEVEDTHPLDYGEIGSVNDILENTNVLESTNVDEEAMRFYINYSVNLLWKRAFRDKGNSKSTYIAVKQKGKNGNRYHDKVVETFLSDFDGTQAISEPRDYSFPYNPTLMQKFVAYKISTTLSFGNFSGTGAGKTLSAILASRIIGSKMTLIVCPNDVVEQWAKHILKVFPNSEVIIRKEAFDAKHEAKKYKYLILNYDKFSQLESPNLILKLTREKIDFVVLDEIHFVKKRDEESSKRRRNLEGLMTQVRRRNKKVKVLGLSATPVVNNLLEGKSLLELITGRVYDDVVTNPTVPNAVTLYEKLSNVSIREIPKYDIKKRTKHLEVYSERPKEISFKALRRNPLVIEKFLTIARIPQILKCVEDKTIIYTEYISEVIEMLSRAVREAGFSYGLYTGEDKTGLSRFLNSRIQVLIASRPLAVGVDGLQHMCNRLIINTLPWTNAQYQQLVGRLERKGQIHDSINIYLIKASIGGYPYDELKWKRIVFKRTLADCAIDGRLPQKNLVTPQQAAMEAVRWLERLSRGEISTIIRRGLEVELAPVEIERRVRKYGDFTKLNNQINNELSVTTFSRMKKDPKLWEEYHRQYREAREKWSIVPYEEIIKRIKRLPKRLHIADFGCGEAKIAEAFPDRIVYSYDYIAVNDKVTTCNMKSVPLPDEELDIAIFSLSLMGRDWHDYIVEAKRCLATNGYLFIAETTKSLSDGGRLSRLRDILKDEGFEIESDEEIGDFTFIDAREYV